MPTFDFSNVLRHLLSVAVRTVFSPLTLFVTLTAVLFSIFRVLLSNFNGLLSSYISSVVLNLSSINSSLLDTLAYCVRFDLVYALICFFLDFLPSLILFFATSTLSLFVAKHSYLLLYKVRHTLKDLVSP